MRQSVDAMQVALRILGVVTAGRDPGWKDIQELYRLATPKDYMPVDELACLVVEESLKRYRTKRAKAKATTPE